jgi:hypothetical protein
MPEIKMAGILLRGRTRFQALILELVARGLPGPDLLTTPDKLRAAMITGAALSHQRVASLLHIHYDSLGTALWGAFASAPILSTTRGLA